MYTDTEIDTLKFWSKKVNAICDVANRRIEIWDTKQHLEQVIECNTKANQIMIKALKRAEETNGNPIEITNTEMLIALVRQQIALLKLRLKERAI